MQGKGRDIEHHMIQCGWNGGLLEGYGEEEAGEVGGEGTFGKPCMSGLSLLVFL